MADKAAPTAAPLPNNLKAVGEHKGVRAIPAPLFLVNFTDGNGVEETKLAIISGEEVRFLANGTLSKPAQSWLKQNILVAAGLKSPDSEESRSVGSIPSPMSPPSAPNLEDQV